MFHKLPMFTQWVMDEYQLPYHAITDGYFTRCGGAYVAELTPFWQAVIGVVDAIVIDVIYDGAYYAPKKWDE